MNSSQSEGNDRPDPLRRRLARGGLAGTVVLSSLISRPVLGNFNNPNTPYDCTISGQLSGNTSPRAGDGVTCSSLGKSPSEWRDLATWPIDKATVEFNNYQGLSPSFIVDANGVVQFSTLTVGTPAKLSQILASNDQGPEFLFGRETIAALLNAIEGGSHPTYGYPLTPAKVVTMYNAVFNGVGTFQANASTPWNRTLVAQYFQGLRTGG
jgi:hypothetical protein